MALDLRHVGALGMKPAAPPIQRRTTRGSSWPGHTATATCGNWVQRRQPRAVVAGHVQVSTRSCRVRVQRCQRHSDRRLPDPALGAAAAPLRQRGWKSGWSSAISRWAWPRLSGQRRLCAMRLSPWILLVRGTAPSAAIHGDGLAGDVACRRGAQSGDAGQFLERDEHALRHRRA